MREVAEILNKPVLLVHRAFARTLMRAMNRTPLLPIGSPPGMVDFLSYPWIAGNDKAKRELGFSPTRTSREAFTEAAGMQVRLLENLGRKSARGFPLFAGLLEASKALAARRGEV
jgi:hypothetical protein